MLWHLITGEYPPQAGGVADYTRLVAQSLVQAGDRVHIWAPRDERAAPSDSGVTVHRLPDSFGPKGLAQLGRGLREIAGRIVVQYVPHMYGYRAMNLAFASWLRFRAPPYWVMFHEVAFPIAAGQTLKHNFLGAVNRVMANLVATGAERIFISAPIWESWLRHCGVRRPVEWLPVPSNIPTAIDSEAAARRRKESLSADGLLIGHFGTYHERDRSQLRDVFAAILRGGDSRRALMVGRGADSFVGEFVAAVPELSGRIVARPDLPGAEVAEHLAACDLLVQPYFDGVSARRGSMMAGLGLGRPIVTNVGWASEPLWQQVGLVPSIPAGDTAGLVRQAEALLASADERERVGRLGKRIYEENFSRERTIERLRI